MYRDQEMRCPRCGDGLVQYSVRDKWRCRNCVGVLARGDELPGVLAMIDSTSVPRARKAASLGCPACAEEMLSYWLDGIEFERCARDGYVWFDRGEIGTLQSFFAEEP